MPGRLILNSISISSPILKPDNFILFKMNLISFGEEKKIFDLNEKEQISFYFMIKKLVYLIILQFFF